jgi:hypothetical protein
MKRSARYAAPRLAVDRLSAADFAFVVERPVWVPR